MMFTPRWVSQRAQSILRARYDRPAKSNSCSATPGIALNAFPEASAMTDMRAALCSRPQESQAVVMRKATTQAAITAMTDLSNAEMVRRLSIKTPQLSEQLRGQW